MNIWLHRILTGAVVLPLLPFAVSAQSGRTNRYTLILNDPPVSARFSSAENATAATVANYREQLRQTHLQIRGILHDKGFHALGEAGTLLNAIFVAAPAGRSVELAAIPGVRGVVPARFLHRNLNRATTIVNAPAVWTAVGGAANAGRGVKIAIIDTGIDQTHPAFAHSTLPMPAGFPKCGTPSDCVNFTNNKVIVARSFVSMIAEGSDPHNPAVDSRPDDLSPRDRFGHGTAGASVAAGETVSGLVAFNGVAPGAWLGNYKVFGTSGLNDNASDQEVVAAIEQAVNDGMDIVNLSLGDTAQTGPLDSGPDCGQPAGVPCDITATAAEAAAHHGVVVVISAGNDNMTGLSYPAWGTVGTPGDAPSAITVGASSNSHVLMASVGMEGQGAPHNLTASIGYSGPWSEPFTAPLVDITTLGDDGQACAPLAGYLTGSIALVVDGGECPNSVRAEHVLEAGGVGMILYAPGSYIVYYTPGTGQLHGAQMSNPDGLALKSYIVSHPGARVTISPVERENTADQMLHFSSVGPAIGDSAIKPDLVAPGGGNWGFNYLKGMYMATASYDAWAEMYSPDGFIAADGTSFSAPMVAGAAALVKQAHPDFTPAQIKSALVNTAAGTILTDDTAAESGATPTPADARWFGAGRLDAAAAVATNVTVAVTENASDTRFLSSLSFGMHDSLATPVSRRLTITNSSSASVNLTLAVTSDHGGLAPTVSSPTLTIAAGQSTTVTVSLFGALPPPGAYSGAVAITGAGVSLHVPWMYLVGDAAAADIRSVMPYEGDTCAPGSHEVLKVRVIDGNGAPLVNTPVHWINDSAKGTLSSDYSNTDKNGVAAIGLAIDGNPGDHPNWAQAGDQTLYLNMFARALPTIRAGNGVLNAASFDTPIAPGSYIAIFGKDLSDFTGLAMTTRLPLAMDETFVSFDVPSAGISVPGHILYESPGQINVQVPWELQGQTSVQMKVGVGYIYGNVYTVPLADYAPAFFEFAPGEVAALDMNSHVIDAGHPAVRGLPATLFANGLGPVTNQPVSGDPATDEPLSVVPDATPVTVTIGGKSAAVLLAGLAPGYAGLYRINVVIPADISAGNQPITVQIGGKTSKASGIVVQ